MSEFLNSITAIRENWKDYPKWDQAQNDKEAQRQALHKTSSLTKEQLEQADKYGRTIVDAVDIMDRNSEDQVENVETVTGMMIGLFPMMIAAIPFIAGFLLSIKNFNFIRNKVIPEANTRTLKEINDNGISKTFFKGFKFGDLFWLTDNYDKNRLKKSGETFLNEDLDIINKHKENFKHDKNIKKLFKNAGITVVSSIATLIASTVGVIIWSTGLEKQSARIARYQARENDLKDPRNFVIYTPEQLEKAKEIAKALPDPPEEKNPLFQSPITRFTGWVGQLRSLMNDNKNYEEWKVQNEKFSKLNYEGHPELTPEELKKAEADRDVMCRIIRKVNDNAEDYAEHMETTAGTLLSSSVVGGAVIGKLLSLIPKVQQTAQQHLKFGDTKVMGSGFVGKNMLSFIGMLAAPILVIPISLKLNKEASRIGRYVAKKELVEDPKNFISYDDEQMNTVKDVKAAPQKENFIQRIVEDMKFLPKAYRLSNEYSKYKKHHLKDKQKLQTALKQVELNQGQLEDAKKLQSKVFNAYEKVDEMSQKYSEDMEAATTIVEEVVPTISMLSIYTPALALFFAILSGKASGAQIAKKLSGILAKASYPLKTKLAKKTILDLANHIEQKYTKYSKKPISNNNVFSDDKSVENFINSLDEKNIENKINELINEDNDMFKFKDLSSEDIAALKKNIKKTVVNIPKEELKTLLNKVYVYYKDDPKTFMNFIENSHGDFLKSPMVTSIAYTTGAAYFILNLGTFYLIQKYFSELQKKAGRIGTMKAVQSLENPKYFADIYKTENNTVNELKTRNSSENNNIISLFRKKQDMARN